MDSKDFKKLFGQVAKDHGFEFAFTGWFKESEECIVVLDLQKSNFGNYYELNIKTFVQGTFGKNYVKSKFLVKNEIGDVFTRQPNEYKDSLDLDVLMEYEKRKQTLEYLFTNFIIPETNKTLTKSGIVELVENGELFLPPAVKNELGIYPDWKPIKVIWGSVDFQEIDKWLHEKIRLHEAKEIITYSSLKNTETPTPWIMRDETSMTSDVQNQPKLQPKVRLIENLLTGELWELVEPSETLKGRFTCLGKSPSYLK